MRGQVAAYEIPAEHVEACRERTMNATAHLHRLVADHDPDEHQTLLALRGVFTAGAEYIDHLIAIDRIENIRHERGLAELRDANGYLEGQIIRATKSA